MTHSSRVSTKFNILNTLRVAALSSADSLSRFQQAFGGGTPYSRQWHEKVATREPLVPTNKPIGIICNQRAHHNSVDDPPSIASEQGLNWASPQTIDELDKVMALFSEQNIATLVIDGGDGTIRDVLTAASCHFGVNMPTVAIIPSGKTNALAIDLGIPATMTLSAVLELVATGRTRRRSPIEIVRLDDLRRPLRGFLFGAGGFVKATALAQTTHRMGAFRGLAVGMAIAAAVAQTIFAGQNNPWRRGNRMRMKPDDGQTIDQSFYLVLGSTLERLPLGLKPFGRVRSGLKLLLIDAPPRYMLAAAPALLAGSEASWLDRGGYRRGDFRTMRIELDTEFIFDGERYPGGDLILRQGKPIDFIVP